MTSSIGFYVEPRPSESNRFEQEDPFGHEDEVFDSQGYLYELPNTSSSVDRSSIGSIPWADDAIKINQMEWIKVENMLSGLEPLSNVEDDLRKEILDWQKKFPQLFKQNKFNKMFMYDSLEVDSLPSLNLTSDDEEYEAECKTTLTRENSKDVKSVRNSIETDSSNLCKLMNNFTLKSLPLKLNKRETVSTLTNTRKRASSTSSYSVQSPPTPAQLSSVTTTTNRFRMPPILNVLDSTRKFRNLGQKKNPSFVQLTQIQQAKSAAQAKHHDSLSHFHTDHRSTWHVPFAANRFLNNKNSIILPSISSTQQSNHRYSTEPTTTSTISDVGSPNTTPSSGGSANVLRLNNNTLSHNVTKRQLISGGFTSNVSTQTNTSNAILGRSISAAVKYPRVTAFNALYLPYSASKFHAFK